MSTLPLPVRPPAVAGTFYPGQEAALASQVDTLLRTAEREQEESASAAASAKAFIVPHAGYIYSGPIAASAYACLKAQKSRIERIVLIGPAHRVYVPGVAAAGARRFATPLGPVEVDLDWLARVPDAETSPAAHAREHSLEVQLPFLQRLLPEVRIVPLLVSDAPSHLVGPVLEALSGGPETVIVVSSDLSHYLRYEQSRAVDEQTARRILALDDSLAGEEACGCAAINGLLWVARRKGLRPRLLDLRSSGDTAGSRDQVVGYAAFAFHEGAHA